MLGSDADERMTWLLAQPGADPPCRHGGFQPEDIWQGDMAFVAEALRGKFWRGTVFLATREQVESSEWWGRNRVGLAVSANAGPFAENIEGRHWVSYPPGCLFMNVPITAEFTDEELLATVRADPSTCLYIQSGQANITLIARSPGGEST